jgi:glucan phosphoethanolaminetransferase (alkaline phosphatase superfamily)
MTPLRRRAWLWALLPLLFGAADWLAVKRHQAGDWDWGQWKVYLTGLLWSWSFFGLAVLAAAWFLSRNAVLRRATKVALSICCLFCLMCVLMSLGYYQSFFHLPNAHSLNFVFKERQNALLIMRAGIVWWHWPLWLALGSGLYGLLVIPALSITAWLAGLRRRWRAALFLLSGALLAVLSIITLGWHRFQYPLPVETNAARALYQVGLMLAGNKTELGVAHRMPLPRAGRPPGFNVLLIINESLRADAFVLGVKMVNQLDADSTAPRMAALQRDSGVLAFPLAWSNSGATNVSVPSLLTGVAPEATTYQFHTAPTLWNIAKSLGLRTFLFTPQDWNWEHFDEYFLDRDVDTAVGRRSFRAPLINDLAVDDALLVESFARFTRSLPEDQNFFGVLEFNSNHAPFYGGPASLRLEAYSRERFILSARHVDSLTSVVFGLLDRSPFLRNTLVWVVSDHGENLLYRNTGRLGCFYDDAMRVPYIIRLPRPLPPGMEGKWAHLAAWRGANVQNLDIVPTLVDLWGRLEILPFRDAYSGWSLASADPAANRILSGQNTCDIRAWTPEGMYVLNWPWTLVLADHHPPAFFNLAQDPLEQDNLWGDAAVRKTHSPWLREYLHAVPGRLDLCRRIGDRCPEELR